jgi:hypothetical protein
MLQNFNAVFTSKSHCNDAHRFLVELCAAADSGDREIMWKPLSIGLTCFKCLVVHTFLVYNHQTPHGLLWTRRKEFQDSLGIINSVLFLDDVQLMWNPLG